MVFRSFSFPLAFSIPPSVLLKLFFFLTNTLLPSTPPHFSRCTEVNCFGLHEHELGLTYWNRDSLAVAVPPKKNDTRPQHPLTAPCPSVRGGHLETTPHAPCTMHHGHDLCRLAQLPWVQDCAVCLMSTRHLFTALFPNLWLLHFPLFPFQTLSEPWGSDRAALLESGTPKPLSSQAWCDLFLW